MHVPRGEFSFFLSPKMTTRRITYIHIYQIVQQETKWVEYHACVRDASFQQYLS